jgi:hypothetical protein
MKALGAKLAEPGAFASPRASGKARLSNKPPPAAALAFRNLRRETRFGDSVAGECPT